MFDEKRNDYHYVKSRSTKFGKKKKYFSFFKSLFGYIAYEKTQLETDFWLR